MGATPRFKIHDETGVYVAATADPTLAAALIGAAGYEGWKVKHTGRIIWREGAEEIAAAESYDRAAEIMDARVPR